MEIKIFKEDNDERIYYSLDGTEKAVLNFENIKLIAKLFIEKKINNSNLTYTINCKDGLDIYKSTLDQVIQSIIKDDELANLYKEHNNETNN